MLVCGCAVDKTNNLKRKAPQLISEVCARSTLFPKLHDVYLAYCSYIFVVNKINACLLTIHEFKFICNVAPNDAFPLFYF